MQARALNESDLTLWRARMPGFVPRIVLPVVLGCLLGVSVGVNIATQVTTTTEQTEGWESPVDAIAYGAVIGAVVMLPFLPRQATWAAVVAALVMAADPLLPWLRVWWLAAAVATLLVGVLDGAGAARQVVAAHAWGAPVVPDLPADERRRAIRWRPVPLLVGIVALAGTVVSVGFWEHDRAAIEAFRATAEVGDGTVTTVDGDDEWADVTIGGRVIRVPTDDTHYDVGQVLGVRYAPNGARAELVEQAFDPAGAGIPAAGCLVVAFVLLASEGVRRREVRSLFTRGGVAVRLRAAAAAEHYQTPVGSLLGPAVRLDLVPCDAPEEGGRVVARLRMRPASSPHEDADDRVAEPSATEAGVLDAPSDEELLDLAHGLVPSAPQVEAGRRDVVVVGLTRYGDHPLAFVGGSWLVSPLAAVEPVRSHVTRRTGGGRSRWVSFWQRVDLGAIRVLRRTGVVSPWLAVPLVYLAFRWAAAQGFDLRLLFLAVMCGTLGYGWMGLVRPILRPTAAGIWVRDGVVDELLPWSQVQGVVADEHGFVVRLADGAVAAGVPKHGRSWLLSGVDDPVVAARTCEEARMRAGAAPGSGPAVPPSTAAGRHEMPSGVRRISPQILCGVAWGVAALLALLVWIR